MDTEARGCVGRILKEWVAVWIFRCKRSCYLSYFVVVVVREDPRSYNILFIFVDVVFYRELMLENLRTIIVVLSGWWCRIVETELLAWNIVVSSNGVEEFYDSLNIRWRYILNFCWRCPWCFRCRVEEVCWYGRMSEQSWASECNWSSKKKYMQQNSVFF